MNILIFNWRDPKNPSAGGAEIVTLAYAKAWIDAGHTVTWFSSYFEGAKESETVDNIKIIRQGSQVFGTQLQGFLWYFFQKHEEFDLVVDEFHGIPFFTPLYVRTKKLAFIHEVTKNVWKFNPWPKPLNLIPYFIGTILEPWIFTLFYSRISFLTVSESTRDDLVAWGISKNRITVIHNGINVSSFNPNSKKEKRKTIIFLGALSTDKGINDVIETFASFHKKDPESQLWMVGNGDQHYVKALKNLSDKLGVRNKVKFWGYVSENKKFGLLTRAHVLINPSVREGWGLVIIEAASQGTPAVVYNVPGLKDSVKDTVTGIIVKKRDPELMADAIYTLLKNKEMYKKYQKNGIAWAKSLTWDKAAKESLRLISKITKEKV